MLASARCESKWLRQSEKLQALLHGSITTPMNLAINAETSSLISEIWVTHFARCSESAVDIEQCECSRISLSFRHDCVLEWPASGTMYVE